MKDFSKTSKTDPLVSIIMPSFEMGHFIGDALKSILDQSYKQWELLVIDDGGKEDGTTKAVEDFAQLTSARVVYQRLSCNRGVAHARNSGIDLARGEYLAFLDPDDRFLPEKLAIQVGILSQDPDIILCHSAVIPEGTLPNSWQNVDIAFPAFECDTKYLLCDQENYLKSNDICTSSVMCRTDLMRRIQFPTGLTFQFEDWVAWCECAQFGFFQYLSSPLTRYRFHPGSFTSRMLSNANLANLAFLEAQCALLSRISNWGFKMRIFKSIILSCLHAVKASKRTPNGD